MAVRRNKNSITISGDDLTNLKAALRRHHRPAKVAPGHAQCPVCMTVLPIRTKEQAISGTCDPCWDRLYAEPEPVTEPDAEEADLF
tara:strand:+ start:487 stop:744 length:258 start_codon:yes stop_codon:yes gene_type:complete